MVQEARGLSREEVTAYNMEHRLPSEKPSLVRLETGVHLIHVSVLCRRMEALVVIRHISVDAVLNILLFKLTYMQARLKSLPFYLVYLFVVYLAM